MKYYLKDNVTDEMLEAVGFEIHHKEDIRFKYALKNYHNFNDCEEEIFISLGKDEGILKIYKMIKWNELYKEDDITSYIQDLIKLDYVEVRE